MSNLVIENFEHAGTYRHCDLFRNVSCDVWLPQLDEPPLLSLSGEDDTTELSNILCSWLGEVCSCCSLTVLPGLAWVLLNYVLQRILLISVYFSQILHSLIDGCRALLLLSMIVKTIHFNIIQNLPINIQAQQCQ